MTIKIQKKSTNTEYDISQYIDQDNDIVINHEHSRTNFDVVFGDVRLVFSNTSGFFYSLFTDLAADWVIIITDGAVNLFGGEIEKSSIEFDCKNEKVSFDVFSINRIFWERARTTKINHYFDTIERAIEYTTLQHLLLFNLYKDYTTNFIDLFDTITILDKNNYPLKYDYDYTNRQIRWYKVSDSYEISSMQSDTDWFFADAAISYSVGDAVAIWGVEGGTYTWVGEQVDINGVHEISAVSGKAFKLDRFDIVISGTGGHIIKVPRNMAGFPADFPFNDSLTGRYADLEDETSIEDLLKALEIFYNAEFYVDFFSKSLIMKRRHSPNEDSVKSIDGLMLDEPTPIIFVEDKDKYDYLYTVVYGTEAPAPLLKSIVEVAPPWTFYDYKPADTIYYVSNTINGNECALSKPLEVQRTWWTLEGSWYTKQQIVLTIPPGISGTSKRTIYSTVLGHPDLGVRKRFEIGNNNTYDWTDLGGYGALIPTWLYEPVAGWIRYDPDTQVWEDITLDVFNGQNRPEGKKIFDVYPQLRFVNAITRMPLNSQTLFDIFCFFGKDSSIENIKENWKLLFVSKAMLLCSVKGTNYKDGDEITKPQYSFLDTLLSNNFRIIRASINMTTERTEIEAIQL